MIHPRYIFYSGWGPLGSLALFGVLVVTPQHEGLSLASMKSWKPQPWGCNANVKQGVSYLLDCYTLGSLDSCCSFQFVSFLAPLVILFSSKYMYTLKRVFIIFCPRFSDILK